MIIQTKNNISQHCPPPSTTSAPEVSLSTTSTTGPRQQQSQLAQTGPPHYVDLHVNAGECVSLQLLDGQEQVVAGPATITMISQQPNPPVPIPVQVPPGHMIHQIADENGTLKHIILSVMDANEDGSQPLDSTVITLPQGTFRIDSNGELVSTSTSERGTSGEAGGGPTPLTTLPQQAYFANYDGCPPNSYEASLSDNIDPSAGGKPQLGPAVDRSSSNYQESDATSSETLSSNEKVTGTVVEQGASNKKTQQSSNSGTSKTSGNSNTSTPVASNHKSSPAGKQVVNSKQIASNHHTINGTVKEGAAEQQQMAAGPKGDVSSTDSQQAEQVVLPAPGDVAPYPAPHQVMANEMELMGSGMAPIISAVDGQLYGYPPCCCCCYCDPAQEAAGVDQPLTGVPGQQDVAGLLALPAGGQPQATADQVGASAPGRANCRALAANNLNQTTNSPVMAYPNPMLAGGRPPAMQAGLGVPIALATGAPLTQPIVGQNGIVPVPSGAHLATDCNTTAVSKVHPGSGKGGRNGYKQLKMVPVSGSQTTGTDRAQQSTYGGGYTGQGGHKTYNSIVSGHHNHSHHNSNHHHHNHHHQQQHYHQPSTDGSSAAAASASMSNFKNQNLMANSHQSSVAGGSYSSSPVYSSYNHVPTATLTNVVSSNSNKAPVQSSQMGNGNALAYGSNSHKQQQQQQLVGQSAANGPANYQHGGRGGPNSDSNYMQRTNRDHVSTYSHSNTNNSASGYVQTNLRQMSHQQQQQHNNENKTRQSQLSDKSSNQQQHNNRYTNVKGMNNNHLATSCNSLTHQSGSVSPIRARMKTSSQQQQHHHHNHHNQNSNHHHHHQQSDLGVRASHSYGQMNDINKDANLLNNLHPANYHGRDQSSSFSSNQSKSASKSNLYPAAQEGPMINNAASNKHINSAGYYASPSHGKQAWQPNSGHKSNQFSTKASHATSGSTDQSAPEVSGGDPTGGEKVVTIISRQQAAPVEAANCDVADSGEHEESNLRSSRNKQEKCHSSSPVKSQLSSEPHSSERHKRSPSKASSSKLSNLDISCPQGDEIEASDKNHPVETNDSKAKADANKARVAKETTGKQQVKQPEGQAKRTSKEKGAAQKPNKQQRVESPKPQAAELPTNPSDGADEIAAQQAPVGGATDSKLFSDSPIENSDSTSDAAEQKVSNSEPAVKPRKNGDRAEGSVENDEQHPLDRDQSESHTNEEVDIDRVSLESRPESPGNLKSPQLSRLTMRTSLSENNIQSLESNTIHQQQQAKQKLLDSAAPKTAASSSNRKKVNDMATSAAAATVVAKRKGNNQGKSEQKVKLSAIPQLKILNLNCTSISSSSVQLRWSYNPSLADKYGIHHHHHAKNALMDHFVIESSNSKNVDANALVSPKIVYQGCALTCRINHLSPEKIYHFKVRRTALLTVTPPSGSAELPTSGEHSVVSEILSVTLPSVQQQNSSTGGQQQLVATGASKRAGRQQRGGSLDGSTSDYQSLTNLGQNNTNEDNHQHHHHHHHQRGNASSHNNNSSNNCGNIINKQSSSSYHSQSIKFTNLIRQCRGKFFATIGRLIKSSLSSYSDTKFAGLLLVIFTIFAMLLAVFIHLYIVAPVTD